MAPRKPSRYDGAEVTMSPSAAIPMSPAVRATALLTPEATPACETGTDPITAVVRGATKSAPPRPRIVAAGKKVVQYDPPVPGKAYARKPKPAKIDPATNGMRGPMRPTRPPDHRDAATKMAMKGSIAAPAPVPTI